MRCPNCGTEAGGDIKFCPRCGYSYDQRAVTPQQGYIQPQPQGMSKTTLVIIILLVVLVIVPVVLSAILYIMVLGFGGTSTTPGATYVQAPITNGEQVTIVAISRTDVRWDDIKVQLSDGTYFAEWDPRTADLDGGSAVTAPYAAEFLGTLLVGLTVTDVGGNGFVSGSDFFRVTATSFDSEAFYSAVLIYEPTGESIGTGVTFAG